MIKAFSTHPSIATQYEDLIGKAMLKMEKGSKWHKDASLARPHGNTKNMGTTKDKHAWRQEEWARRAKRVRAYLEKNPGARTVDLAEGVGVDMRTMAAWCDKFRGSPDTFKIKYVKSMGTKKYNYWRSEDAPKFGDAK